MPTYSYVCNGCGHKFDILQSMTDDVLKACPECEQPVLRRLIGAGSGLIFKGSGFYITDYARQPKTGGTASGAGGRSSNGNSSAGEKGASKAPGKAGAAKPETVGKP